MPIISYTLIFIIVVVVVLCYFQEFPNILNFCGPSMYLNLDDFFSGRENGVTIVDSYVGSFNCCEAPSLHLFITVVDPFLVYFLIMEMVYPSFVEVGPIIQII